MNKKPGLLFVVSLLAIIILAASFNMNFGGNAPIHLPAGVNPDNVLYVCPIGSESAWGQFSTALHAVGKYVWLFLAFMVLVLMFSWGWALYQNLLKDSFKRESFKNPWAFTKMWFWAGIIILIMALTPNHFREVHLTGSTSSYVLCDNNTPGARAVRASAVHN